MFYAIVIGVKLIKIVMDGEDNPLYFRIPNKQVTANWTHIFIKATEYGIKFQITALKQVDPQNSFRCPHP